MSARFTRVGPGQQQRRKLVADQIAGGPWAARQVYPTVENLLDDLALVRFENASWTELLRSALCRSCINSTLHPPSSVMCGRAAYRPIPIEVE